jgi:hypothetical protein
MMTGGHGLDANHGLDLALGLPALVARSKLHSHGEITCINDKGTCRCSGRVLQLQSC